MRLIDITGLRYGRVKVINRNYSIKNYKGKYTKWNCICDCGKEFATEGHSLRSGHTTSCGCFRVEKVQSTCRTGTNNITGRYWGHLLRGAKVRNIPVEINKEYAQKLLELQGFKCNLSGESLICDINNTGKLRGSDWINTASLDRIDSTKGYIEGNVQWIHKVVNIMKNKFPQEDFVNYCCKIADNTRGKI